MKFNKKMFSNPLYYTEAALCIFLVGIILLPVTLSSDLLTKTRILPEHFRRELYEFFIGNIPETYGILWSLCFLLVLTALVMEILLKNHAGKKKVMFITGYFFALIFTLFNLLPVTYTDYSEVARRISCIGRLKAIGFSLNLYAAENNGYYPPDLETLNLDNASILCPSNRNNFGSGSNYFYHGKGKKNTDALFIIVEDRPENHPGTFRGILYSNGMANDIHQPLW